MGFIADIFKLIAKAIKAVFDAIGKIIKWIGTKLLPILVKIGIAVFLVVATLGIFAPAAAAAIGSAMLNILGAVGGTLINIISKIPSVVVAGVKGIVKAFATFLEMIHFKTLLQIHKIAYILSADYRELVQGLYKEISKVSEALFDNSMTLHLIFQNTRTLFMSGAALLGYTYDPAQIAWLQRFDEILVKFNERAEIYRDHPEQLFSDLEEWSDKYSQDLGGSAQSVIISTIEGILVSVDATVERIGVVNNALYELEQSLPEDVRKYVLPVTEPIHKKIDTFIYDEYKPKIGQLNAALDDNVRQTREHRAEVSSIVERLKNPLDYLREIDLQPGRIRIDAEGGLEEISSRPFRESADQAETHNLVEEEEYISALEQLRAETPPPSILTYEVIEPTILHLSKSTQRGSPFVGDY